MKFPRTLQCEKAVRRDRAVYDPITKATGRCGECRRCWRLFLWVRRRAGITGPIRWYGGKFAGFTNAKARPRQGAA